MTEPRGKSTRSGASEDAPPKGGKNISLGPSAKRVEDAHGRDARAEADAGRSSSESAGVNEAPSGKGEPKDVGFGASHGYAEGHGGPTSPGDAPAKGDAKAPSEGGPDRGARVSGEDPRPDE